jgi:ABC-2 type transport system permease protein
MRRFVADTLLLLDLQRRLAWNGFRSRSLPRQALSALGALLMALVGGGVSASFGYALGRIARRLPGEGLEPVLPGLALSAAAALLVFVAFAAVLGSLFLSSDLELIMAAPLDRRAVFTARVLDGVGWYYLVLAVGAGPGLVAYGLGLGYAPAYFAFAAVALAGTPLLPAGLAALLVMVVVRFAPARVVREVLGLVAVLTGVGVSFGFQWARSWSRGFGPRGAAGEAASRPDVDALLDQLTGIASLPLPTFAAGRGLAAAGRGDLPEALPALAAFLALTFGLFAVCVALAERLHAAGWARLQGSGAARRRPLAAVAGSSGGWLARAPAPLALAVKDWRLMPRDLISYRQLLGPLVAAPILYFNLVSRPPGRRVSPLEAAQRLTPADLDLAGVAAAAGVLLLCLTVFNRIALTGIARERSTWWVLKAAPLSGRDLLAGKLLVPALPFAALSTVLFAVAAAWSGFSLLGAAYGWFGIQLLGLGLLGVNVALGVPTARLDWDDPRRMVSPWGGLASFLAMASLCLAGGGLLTLPLLAAALAPEWTRTAWLFAPAAATIVTAGAAAISLRFAAARLPHVGEH